jgi:GDPmannose 4,6-dehydratase
VSKSKALIFGISGQTGSYLAHLLLNKGYAVYGTSRDSEVNSFINLQRLGILDKTHLRSASLTDVRSVLRVLQEIQPDEIYNLAGQSSVALSFEQPQETFESIAVATLNILECLRIHRLPVRFFNATSTDCFGETAAPADEISPFRPRSPYAVAKATSHWAVANYRDSYGMEVYNGILSNHESPFRPNRFVTRKIILAVARIAAGSTERLSMGNLDVERDWGWAPDYAEAIWRITQHDVPSDFVVATGQTSSLRKFIELAFSYFGLDWEGHVDIKETLLRPSDIPRVELSAEKIAGTLGWRASIKMPELVAAIINCHLKNELGPVPWQSGPIADRVAGMVAG